MNLIYYAECFKISMRINVTVTNCNENNCNQSTCPWIQDTGVSWTRSSRLDCRIGRVPNRHSPAMLRLKTVLNMTRYGNLCRGKRSTMIAMFMQFKDSGNQRWGPPPPPHLPCLFRGYPNTSRPIWRSLSYNHCFGFSRSLLRHEVSTQRTAAQIILLGQVGTRMRTTSLVPWPSVWGAKGC